MVPSDDELLDLARAGDRKAFRLLVERYEPKVAATVIGMLGNVPEADDVGQEVFVRFYRSIDRFRGEASLGTYLTRIAINQSLKAIKRRQSWSSRFSRLDSVAESRIATDGEVEKVERSELVQRALSQLKPDHRAVAVLRLMEGYSTREVAEILGVPQGTVMSRLSRAVSALGEILQPEFEQAP
jgi:RNA polymerase sigma-70 factor (ECF subfamily)